MENIIFASPFMGKSTKGYELLNYIENNNIQIDNHHIIFVDDLFENIMDVIKSLDILKNQFDVTYITFQYVQNI